MRILRSALPIALLAAAACFGQGRPPYEVPIDFDDLTTAPVRNQFLSETFMPPGQAADWRIHEESRASVVAGH